MKKEIDMSDKLHAGHRERLRTLASQNGITNLAPHQALELLLSYVIPQKDTNPIAHELINAFGSFSAVIDAKPENLMKINGIGLKTALFLVSLKDFFYFYKVNKLSKTTLIKTSAEAERFARELLGDKPYEEMIVIVLDGMNYVKHYETLSKGTSNATNLCVRDLTEVVFKHNASNVILCHNHPTGKSLPTSQDNKLTKSVVTALTLNGIYLLDHIIIGKDDFYSYHRNGLIKIFEEEIVSITSDGIAMQKKCEYNN